VKKLILFILLFSTQVIFSQDYFLLKDSIIKTYRVCPKAEDPVFDVETITKTNVGYTQIVKSTFGDMVTVNTALFEIKKDGVYEVAWGGGFLKSPIESHKYPYLLIKYPVKKNNEWSYSKDNGVIIQRKVVKLLSNFEVGGVIYSDVILIKQTNNDGGYPFISFEYYAKDIGLILVETEDKQVFKFLVSSD